MPIDTDTQAALDSLKSYIDGVAKFVGYTPPVVPLPPAPGLPFTDSFDTLSANWKPVGPNAVWTALNGVVAQSLDAAGDPKKLILGITVPAAVQVTAKVLATSWKGGDWARAGVGICTGADGKGYNLVLRDGNTIRFLDDGVRWGNSFPYTWKPGEWHHITLATDGKGNLYGKAWLDGTPEPTGWFCTQPGWTNRTTGAVALNGGSGSCTVSFDDVTVTDATGATFPVVLPPPPPPPPPPSPATVLQIQGAYPITLRCTGMDAARLAIFSQAATWWASAITAALSEWTLLDGVTKTTGIVIDCQCVSIDGGGGILGQGMPLHYRTDATKLPYQGAMTFDIADSLTVPIVKHEMGHALGFGVMWSMKGLIQNPSTADPRFTGPKATAEYNRIFGKSEAGVPVEGGTLSGTSNVHWREGIFGGELFTGWLNGSELTSTITLASMADLGYSVDLTKADQGWQPGQLMQATWPRRRCGCGHIHERTA